MVTRTGAETGAAKGTGREGDSDQEAAAVAVPAFGTGPRRGKVVIVVATEAASTALRNEQKARHTHAGPSLCAWLYLRARCMVPPHVLQVAGNVVGPPVATCRHSGQADARFQ